MNQINGYVIDQQYTSDYHHAYTPGDFAFGSKLPILMTEKDAVKCAAFVEAQAYTVPVDAQLPEAFWIALLDRLPARLR